LCTREREAAHGGGVMLPSTIGTRYRSPRGKTERVIFELVASADEGAAGCYRHTMRYVEVSGFAPDSDAAPVVGETFTVEDAWFRERTDIKAVL
jgi:hypothetical protein